MDKEVIRLDHISKQFNQIPVLKDITAKLHKGEILGFLGPSGAGKTTTIKACCGIMDFDGAAFAGVCFLFFVRAVYRFFGKTDRASSVVVCADYPI